MWHLFAAGGFGAVHRLVSGATLTENRRQRDDTDRAALAAWLDGARGTALSIWGRAGRVHAPSTSHDAYREIVTSWWADRHGVADAHDALTGILVLAARNADVDEINRRMRSTARDAGLVAAEGVSFAQRGGGRIEFAAGDVIRVRRNDYRSRKGSAEPDVLNGFRGVVTAVEGRRGVRIEWRNKGTTTSAWVSPDAIARGDLSHGFAMTIAAAQGLTCDRVHVYGIGADAHSLYPAMSRGRTRADLYLSADALETPQTRAQLGEAVSDADVVSRAIGAYAATLTDDDDGLVIDELDLDLETDETVAVRVSVQVDSDGRLQDEPEGSDRDPPESADSEPSTRDPVRAASQALAGTHTRRRMGQDDGAVRKPPEPTRPSDSTPRGRSRRGQRP